MRVVLDGVFNHTGAASGRSTTSSRPAPARPTATGSTSTRRRSAAAGRLYAYPDPHGHAAHRSPWLRARGGGCRRCRSSTPTSRSVASTCRAWPSTGSASASTAGAWTSRGDRRRGVLAGVPAALSGRDPRRTSSARSGTIAPEWLRGDRFDALMNYPLTEAILGLRRGSRLDMAVVRAHSTSTARSPAPRRTGASRHGSSTSGRPTTRPSSRSNSTSSGHTIPRVSGRPGWRPGRGPPRDPAPGDAARSAMHLLRRRDRPDRPRRPGVSRRVPLDPSRWETGLHETTRALSISGPPSRHFATRRSGSPAR